MLTRIDTKATFSQKKDDNGRSVCSDRIYFLWFLLSFRCSICFYQAITEIEMKRKLVRRINKRKNVVSSTLVRKTFFLIDFFLCFGCVKNTRAISCCKGMLEHLRMGKKYRRICSKRTKIKKTFTLFEPSTQCMLQIY